MPNFWLFPFFPSSSGPPLGSEPCRLTQGLLPLSSQWLVLPDFSPWCSIVTLLLGSATSWLTRGPRKSSDSLSLLQGPLSYPSDSCKPAEPMVHRADLSPSLALLHFYFVALFSWAPRPHPFTQQHVPQEHSHRQAMFLFLSANSILNQSHILLSNSNCILLLNTYYSWISLISLTRYKHTWLIYIVLINRFWTKNFSNYLLNECNRVIFQNQATYITIT